MGIMLVNQHIKPRICHDGGISKAVEMFPTPVRMESFQEIFNICPQGHPFVKIDDSKGLSVTHN